MSYEIKNREIFAVGKHNGDSYSMKDLEMIVKAAHEIDFLPAIKLGHKHESGAPAYGYLSNMRIVGEKIVADMINLPKEIYQAIKEKRYARVSVEIYENLNRSGKVFKKAIGAIALLGQEIAGVAGLKTPTKFKSGDFDSLSEYSFDIIENANHTKSDGDSGANSGNNNGDDNMSTKELETANGKITDLEAQVKTLTENATTGEGKAKEFENKFNAAQAELATLKASAITKDAETKAKLVTIPALQSAFQALYTQALIESDTKVKVFNAETKTDEDKTMVEVLDSMVTYFNDKAKVIFKEYGQSKGDRSEGYENPADEVDERAVKLMAKNKSDDYQAAVKAVLDADQDLKTAYAQI